MACSVVVDALGFAFSRDFRVPIFDGLFEVCLRLSGHECYRSSLSTFAAKGPLSGVVLLFWMKSLGRLRLLLFESFVISVGFVYCVSNPLVPFMVRWYQR